ncbi:hypothetical protein PsYK624_015040 [Phanerochaete sordida]|uniref:Uncharacterized protein n=1 Tax=Phanerochaete sordida TaxID=48140 RepID=A0A9P3G0D8_9APHY|nr:hypothetical protein PsYK624_015040 [Phanerochaete sordida]
MQQGPRSTRSQPKVSLSRLRCTFRRRSAGRDRRRAQRRPNADGTTNECDSRLDYRGYGWRRAGLECLPSTFLRRAAHTSAIALTRGVQGK